MLIKNAIRKLNYDLIHLCHKRIGAKIIFFRYNGGNIVTEPSSRFNHTRVGALGSYRGSPFVTGSNNTADGLKTEILNKQFLEWVQEADYPFSDSDR